MKNQQSGFTLIELIMVIVILGILAAFAVPKFSGLSADARAATMQGVVASVKSASSMAHASWLAKNSATVTSITLEDGTAIGITNGYPSAADIANAAGVDTTEFTVVSTGPTTITAKGAGTAANCQVSYTAATTALPPVIAIDVTDC